MVWNRPRTWLIAAAVIASGTVALSQVSGETATTIDPELQRVVESALAEHEAGAAVVVEVDTGRILASVSTPADGPDRTYQRAYPPASTFKLITAVAGLESGMASRDEELTCTGQRTVGGRVLRDMGTHGTLDLVEALQRSCNIYFWKIGERVGLDRMVAVAHDFGFGEKTGLGSPGEVAGVIPDGGRYGDSTGDRVKRVNTAIGSGDVKATVLQVAMAYAALANGGRLYEPQLAAGRAPVLRRKVHASPATLSIIRQGMYRAVNKRGGTAVKAKRGAVKMIGKTGTSKSRDPRTDEPHAWFAGVAPVDHPKVVVVVLIEHGGIGGAVAAPVAREIIDGYFTKDRRHAMRH